MTSPAVERPVVRDGLSFRDVAPARLLWEPACADTLADLAWLRWSLERRRSQQPLILTCLSPLRRSSLPAWLEPTVRSLAALTTVQPNWDSYGAPSISPLLIQAGVRLLTLVMRDDAPPPAVVPTSAGSVAFEWHQRGIDLEVEVVSPSRFHVYFLDHETGREWEGDLSSNLSRLVAFIEVLTRRGD